MKGTYVLAIALLASVATANEEKDLAQPDAPKMESAVFYGIHTTCPLLEKSENTTTNLAHESDCSKFYKCFLGKGQLQECPYMEKNSLRRLHYNIFEQVCDWPWRAGCSSCPGADENGVFPPPSKIAHQTNGINNCRLFYNCHNGIAIPGECPYGTCFSRTCQACVSNYQGGVCKDSEVIPPVSPTPSTPSTPKPTSTEKWIPWYPPKPICKFGSRKLHDCDCRKYYECDDNDWLLNECDGGLHFDSNLQKCLPPNDAKCIHKFS